MTVRPLFIIGAGGHARACIDVIERHGGFKIIGLIGQADEIGRKVLGHRVVGCDSDLPSMAGTGSCAIVSVGQIRTSKVRRNLFEKLQQIGFELPAIISPLAFVSRHASVASGTIVMHKAIVNAGASIGSNCIINTSALIEHDCQIGDHCHISTGSILNGGVRLGTGCFVGSGSVVCEECSIGDGSLIGMGLAVRRGVAPDTIFTG